MFGRSWLIKKIKYWYGDAHNKTLPRVSLVEGRKFDSLKQDILILRKIYWSRLIKIRNGWINKKFYKLKWIWISFKKYREGIWKKVS
jgi:hypothetical protein